MSAVTAGSTAETAAGAVAGPARTRLVARCGPLSLLAVSFLSIVASLFVDDWRTGAVALGVQLSLAPFAVSGLRAAALRLLPVCIAALSVAWSTWLLGEGGPQRLEVAVTAALRIVVLVLPGALLVSWIDPSRLGDHLAQRLHLPARAVVAAAAALQRFESLHETWDSLARARRARGLGPGRSPAGRVRFFAGMAFGMLVGALRSAERMAVAMDARGFADCSRRTWAEPAPWTRADSALVAVGALVAAVPVCVTLWLR
ncbi:energy-coupling factor transport system permease protein [Kineococcus xinjiangensis]|uniref:Energy-coupling factor transport system permease protein n=1 Tax=Kineococcus xinjiangensis TaxID=512762 RepID=A0A2S6IUR9_9ACTN|nr:energy-coupling factor transporter transmembrane component T [Kineococcus xinjiangensis]PPK98017.1 energy-coupling factor transport system permease protein [Kineococcus xinjiangensis]